MRVVGCNVFTSGRWIVLQAVEAEAEDERGSADVTSVAATPQGDQEHGNRRSSHWLQQPPPPPRSAVHLSVLKVNGP